MTWPASKEELERAQRELAVRAFEPWTPPVGPIVVAGAFVCFPHGARGARGEPAWAAAVAVAVRDLAIVAESVVREEARAPYVPGLLALREGALLEAAVRGLSVAPDCLLVNATGRDHPRRAGLALELGVVVETPTVGITDRPLVGQGALPASARGSTSAIRVGDEVVAAWLRTRADTRPVVVHPAHRTDLATAIALVLACSRGTRTPEPLRQARRLARSRRAAPTCPPTGTTRAR